MSDKAASFSQRLREALDARGMKQVELAEKSQISKSSISRYLKGDWEGKQSAVYALAKALGVTEAWLMGYDVPVEKKDTSAPKITDSQLKFALFGDAEIDDDVLDDVKRLAKLHMELRKQEKNEKK